MKKTKYLCLLLFMMICCSPVCVKAEGSVITSTNIISVEAGGSSTFTITAINAAGRIDISSSDPSVATVNVNSSFLDNSSVTVTVTTHNVGSCSISVSLTDVGTYDGDVLTQGLVIYVESKATAVAPPITPPANNNTNTGGTTTNGNTNSNNANSNANNNNTNENTETKIEETTTDKEPAKELKPLEITKFEVLGYDLKFDRDTKIYELKIDKNVTKLYLIVEGKDITIEGNGIVDITDKDKVTLKIKNSDQEVEYTINLKKQALGANVIANTKNQGNIFMATTVIFGWSTLILAFFLVKDIIKFKKQKKDSL